MWLYKGEVISEITQFPSDVHGFIYETTHIPTGKKYLGKKTLFYNKKKKLTKKELLAYEGKPGRKPTHIRIQSESDWKKYYGSEETIKQLLKEGKHEEFQREIIDLAYDKKHLTYLETKYLFTNNVLENDEYLNSNILGKFFRNDFDKS